MMINWSSREIDVFLVLAETLSFRRTAERVHLSQPAVTGVVGRLEEALGVRLFDRTTRQVQLTGPGQVFLEQAQRLRHMTGEAVRAVREVATLQVGQVAMAAMPSLAATVVPRAFARFKAQYPGVRLALMDTLSDPAFELVRAGRVDFALTAANPAYVDLDYLPLASDGFVLLIPEGHALARSRKALAWADVAQLPHISMPLPSSVRQYADAAFLEQRIRFSPQFELEHLASIKALVSAGLGVAALPELAANVGPDEGIVRRPLRAPDLRRPIGLVTLRGRSLSPAAQAMVDLLREAVSKFAKP
jgi:LysR family transcriptional regulator, carnitine catabolism transcriptional activator